MANSGFDKFMETAGNVAAGAGKVAGELVSKGHDKASELALNARISKLHRQLGALVYALRKNGEENEPMIQWYVDEIDRLKAQIPGVHSPSGPGSSIRFYGSTGEGVDNGDAMFRGGAGDELP